MVFIFSTIHHSPCLRKWSSFQCYSWKSWRFLHSRQATVDSLQPQSQFVTSGLGYCAAVVGQERPEPPVIFSCPWGRIDARSGLKGRAHNSGLTWMNTDGSCLPGGLEGVASAINHVTVASCRPTRGNIGTRRSERKWDSKYRVRRFQCNFLRLLNATWQEKRWVSKRQGFSATFRRSFYTITIVLPLAHASHNLCLPSSASSFITLFRASFR